MTRLLFISSLLMRNKPIMILLVIALLSGAAASLPLDVTSPTITSVAFTNVPPNANYSTIGNHIEVTVTFDQAVTVTGTPHVRLTWFTSLTRSTVVKRAEHVPSASSGASQVFRYTVAEDDLAVIVEVAENALRLNGGTIVAGGTPANLNHAGVGCPNDCVVDARVPRIVAPRSTPPYVHRVDTDLNGTVDTFPPNSKLHYSILFDVAGMTVDTAGSNANVQIVVVIGDRRQALDFNSVGMGSDGRNGELVFGPYTVAAEDRDTDGIEVVPDGSGNLIRLSNGATVEGNGNVADLSGVASVQERTMVRGTNAVPTGSDLTMTTVADTDLNFTKADFTFADSDGDLLKEIRIAALPASTAGELKLSGTAISSSDLPKTVSVFDLSAGKLVFDPKANFNGTTSFTFYVVDTFGAAAASGNTARITVGQLLTATFHDVPPEHDGETAFSFELRFSDDFLGRLDYKKLRDEAFLVTNGRVIGVQRVAPNQNQRWTITVRPWSHEEMEVRLPAGSVRTESDRQLANTISATVAGPVIPPLTATFHDVPPEHDGETAFSFELRFNDDFPGRLDYKKLRDEAFLVTNGRVIGVQRVAPNQNQRWTITVRPWSHEEVEVRLPAGSVHTELGRQLANAISATVTGPVGQPADAQVSQQEDAAEEVEEDVVVSGLSVTSSPQDGDTYVCGELIRVALTFSEAVQVTGSPSINIDMDPADWGTKVAAYEGGSGSTELIFVHTVVNPNYSTQGIAVLANTLQLNGGSIRASGRDADLSHAGLDHNSNHKVHAQCSTGKATVPLLINHPNPFNAATTIKYALPQAADVELTVYNVVGQPVRTLVAEHQSAGRYVVEWDATNDSGYSLPSGMYFYRLQAGGEFREVEKMLLLK